MSPRLETTFVFFNDSAVETRNNPPVEFCTRYTSTKTSSAKNRRGVLATCVCRLSIQMWQLPCSKIPFVHHNTTTALSTTVVRFSCPAKNAWMVESHDANSSLSFSFALLHRIRLDRLPCLVDSRTQRYAGCTVPACDIAWRWAAVSLHLVHYHVLVLGTIILCKDW